MKKSPKQVEIKEIEHFYRYERSVENDISNFCKEYLRYSFFYQHEKLMVLFLINRIHYFQYRTIWELETICGFYSLY